MNFGSRFHDFFGQVCLASGKSKHLAAICNLSPRRFIPQVVNLRTPMLLAGLCAGILHGQTAAPPQAGAPGNGSSTRAGAAPTRATGQSPTAPGLTGTTPSYQPLGNANAAGNGNTVANGDNSTAANGNSGNSSGGGNAQGGNNQPPAPAATGNVQVTGRPAQTSNVTADRPLLPIVGPGNGLGIRSGTPIRVKLRVAVDSGHARNGDMIDGTLATSIAGLPVGTPVRLTVVQAVSAGRLTSYGELSLQVVSIADRRVLSDTITAQGKEGPKDLPDAAPARGTEAIFTPDQPISLPAS